MADMRNRTPFYGAVPTSKLNADHVFMADGSTLQEQADKKFELLESITTEEAVSRVDIIIPDCKSLIVEYIIEASDTTGTLAEAFYNDADEIRVNTTGSAIATAKKYFIQGFLNIKDFQLFFTESVIGNSTGVAATYTRSNFGTVETINKIAIYPLGGLTIPVGSTINVYGIKE